MLFSQYQYSPPGGKYSPSYTFLVYSVSNDSLSISILKDFNDALVHQGNNRGFDITNAVGQIDNLLNARVEARKNFKSMLIEEKFIPEKNSVKIRMFYTYSYSELPFYENIYKIDLNYDSLAVNVISDIQMYLQNRFKSFNENINESGHLAFGMGLLASFSGASLQTSDNLIGGFSFFARYWQKTAGIFLDLKAFDHPGAPLWIIDLVKLERGQGSIIYYGGGLGISGSRDVLVNVRIGTFMFENAAVSAFPEINVGITNNEDLPFFVTAEIGIGFSSTLNIFNIF